MALSLRPPTGLPREQLAQHRHASDRHLDGVPAQVVVAASAGRRHRDGQVAEAGDFPEISLLIPRSLDERKGVVIIEDCLFQSESEFRAFRSWPPHAELGAFMSTRADWLVADFEEQDVDGRVS